MIRRLVALVMLASGASAEVNGAKILELRPPRDLAEFGFFDDPKGNDPSENVTPYAISAPLFSDNAEKMRFVYTPKPVEATDGVLEFPIGAALVKTFHYGSRKVETRLLLHQDTGWKGYAYVWNEDGTSAALAIAGADLDIETSRGLVRYRVPNANQCKACHVSVSGDLAPIGPKLRNLNMGNQLARLVDAGVLASLPRRPGQTPDYRDAEIAVADRARAYLDANCAHCHAPGLPGETSGLYLNWEETRPTHLGILKRPVAAGRGSGGLEFSIVPGNPEASILHFRMASTDPAVMMPEIGRSVVDEEGLALIAAYIEGLE